ncbi:hypothetical protein GMDG_07260 [Pseudogymnoascus destructans 20631-21]|uniref:Uncharacterized protein n=1 Tax=Pseudogymnoascus destructans (strain ATCC MYA-4855 / 20631-21) TaxID=658429 RepID=L8FWK5_PSED2|nr:hypothetical protein GMDG_07260 [Pseudogymnoascus destructans 20631-21]
MMIPPFHSVSVPPFDVHWSRRGATWFVSYCNGRDGMGYLTHCSTKADGGGCGYPVVRPGGDGRGRHGQGCFTGLWLAHFCSLVVYRLGWSGPFKYRDGRIGREGREGGGEANSSFYGSAAWIRGLMVYGLQRYKLQHNARSLTRLADRPAEIAESDGENFNSSFPPYGQMLCAKLAKKPCRCATPSGPFRPSVAHGNVVPCHRPDAE